MMIGWFVKLAKDGVTAPDIPEVPLLNSAPNTNKLTEPSAKSVSVENAALSYLLAVIVVAVTADTNALTVVVPSETTIVWLARTACPADTVITPVEATNAAPS